MLYHSLINSWAQYGITVWGRAASCHVQPISVVSNRPMRCLITNELETNIVTTIYKTQKILQLKHVYNLEDRKFLYEYTNFQLPATFNNYFKLITDVHPYNTRKIKTQQFALPTTRWNSRAKMIKHSWNLVKNSFCNKKINRVWHFFQRSIKNMYYSATRNIFVLFFLVYINQMHWFNYQMLLQWK